MAGCVDPDLRAGRDALGQGRYTEAIEAFGRARDRGLSPTDWKANLAGAHRAEGLQQIEAKACAAASTHFDRAAALSSPLLRDAEAVYRCQVATGALPAGHLPALENLFTLGDRRVPLLRDLFEGYAEAGRMDDHLRLAGELEQRHHLTHDDRARVWPLLLERGEVAKARHHVEVLAQAAPEDPLRRLKLAELREADKDLAGARAVLYQLTIDLPNNPVVFLRYADFLQRQGDTERAGSARARADVLRGVVRTPDDRVMRPLKKSRR